MKVLILGGTRFVGRLVARRSARRGRRGHPPSPGHHRGGRGRSTIRHGRPLRARRARGPRPGALRRRDRHVGLLLGLDCCHRAGTRRTGRPVRLHLERRRVPALSRAPVERVHAARAESDLGWVRQREGRLGGSALGGPCRGELRRHDVSPALHPRPGEFRRPGVVRVRPARSRTGRSCSPVAGRRSTSSSTPTTSREPWSPPSSARPPRRDRSTTARTSR